MLIAVDFDGTIVDHQFPDVGEPNPGAIDWMKLWQDAGARLILWTMRGTPIPDGVSDEGHKADRDHLKEAVDYCGSNGILFYSVNGNPTQKTWTCSPKAYAHVYVDDAAFGCPLRPGATPTSRPMVDWDVVGPAILERLTSK